MKRKAPKKRFKGVTGSYDVPYYIGDMSIPMQFLLLKCIQLIEDRMRPLRPRWSEVSFVYFVNNGGDSGWCLVVTTMNGSYVEIHMWDVIIRKMYSPKKDILYEDGHLKAVDREGKACSTCTGHKFLRCEAWGTFSPCPECNSKHQMPLRL